MNTAYWAELASLLAWVALELILRSAPGTPGAWTPMPVTRAAPSS